MHRRGCGDEVGGRDLRDPLAVQPGARGKRELGAPAQRVRGQHRTDLAPRFRGVAVEVLPHDLGAEPGGDAQARVEVDRAQPRRHGAVQVRRGRARADRELAVDRWPDRRLRAGRVVGQQRDVVAGVDQAGAQRVEVARPDQRLDIGRRAAGRPQRDLQLERAAAVRVRAGRPLSG